MEKYSPWPGLGCRPSPESLLEARRVKYNLQVLLKPQSEEIFPGRKRSMQNNSLYMFFFFALHDVISLE